jgi:hypothetical protein
MFDFLTVEENLNGLIIGMNQFGIIRENLISTFWNKVLYNLKEHFKGNLRWEVKIDSNIFNQYSKLYLCDKKVGTSDNGYPSLFFCWERLSSSYPYYGIFTNLESKQFDFDKVSSFLISQKTGKLSGFESEPKWPLWTGDINFDFNDHKTLLQIIPSKVDEKAKEFSTLLLDFFESIQESYEIILREYKTETKPITSLQS